MYIHVCIGLEAALLGIRALRGGASEKASVAALAAAALLLLLQDLLLGEHGQLQEAQVPGDLASRGRELPLAFGTGSALRGLQAGPPATRGQIIETQAEVVLCRGNAPRQGRALAPDATRDLGLLLRRLGLLGRRCWGVAKAAAFTDHILAERADEARLVSADLALPIHAEDDGRRPGAEAAEPTPRRPPLRASLQDLAVIVIVKVIIQITII